MKKSILLKELRGVPREDVEGVMASLESRSASNVVDMANYYRVMNISESGIFILADDPIDEETEVTVNIFFPRSKFPLKIDGEVVWNRRGYQSGFAVKFTEISDFIKNTVRLSVRAFRIQKTI
jgi:hypothetical protein